MLRSLLSNTNVSSAADWLCGQRINAPDNADIWNFRAHEGELIAQITAEIATNQFYFTPMQKFDKVDGSSVVMWSSRDALVLKMMAQVLSPILPCHSSCMHIKGHGGAKQSVNLVDQWVRSGSFPYVCRTDIKGYYANINKHQLLEQLAVYVKCPIMLNLLAQYLFYTVEYGGTFHSPDKGICRGCALSPLMAGFQLYKVDEWFSGQKHLRYVRYMDDFLILAKTRWHLRLAVKHLNVFFAEFGFAQHPDKTFIGRIDKGFDWLGYQFAKVGVLAASPRTLANHQNKLSQLYEQARRLNLSKTEVTVRVAKYIKRWQGWLQAGLLKKFAFDYNAEMNPT